MWARRLLIILSITLVSGAGLAACTPGSAGNASAGAPPAAPVTAASPAQSAGAGEVVDAAPLSETAAISEEGEAVQTPGQTEAGGGAAEGGTPVTSETQGEAQQPAATLVYSDSTYLFSVEYPGNFVFRNQPAEKLAQLKPMPVAAFSWINPGAAASDVAELEPADLEVRVYAVGESASIEEWLTAQGLWSAGGGVSLKPFEAANASGVELCAATMIAPGCAYFVMGSGWVYELVPATVEGDSMAHSFRLLP